MSTCDCAKTTNAVEKLLGRLEEMTPEARARLAVYGHHIACPALPWPTPEQEARRMALEAEFGGAPPWRRTPEQLSLLEVA